MKLKYLVLVVVIILLSVVPTAQAFCPQNCPQPTCNPWTQDCSKSGGCGGLDCAVDTVYAINVMEVTTTSHWIHAHGVK